MGTTIFNHSSSLNNATCVYMLLLLKGLPTLLLVVCMLFIVDACILLLVCLCWSSFACHTLQKHQVCEQLSKSFGDGVPQDYQLRLAQIYM